MLDDDDYELALHLYGNHADINIIGGGKVKLNFITH